MEIQRYDNSKLEKDFFIDGRLYVYCPFSYKDEIKKHSFRWDPNIKTWYIEKGRLNENTINFINKLKYNNGNYYFIYIKRRTEIEKTKGLYECQICTKEEYKTQLTKCCNQSLCMKCMDKLDICPYCRKKFNFKLWHSIHSTTHEKLFILYVKNLIKENKLNCADTYEDVEGCKHSGTDYKKLYKLIYDNILKEFNTNKFDSITMEKDKVTKKLDNDIIENYVFRANEFVIAIENDYDISISEYNDI
jgi:hypothetical protein